MAWQTVTPEEITFGAPPEGAQPAEVISPQERQFAAQQVDPAALQGKILSGEPLSDVEMQALEQLPSAGEQLGQAVQPVVQGGVEAALTPGGQMAIAAGTGGLSTAAGGTLAAWAARGMGMGQRAVGAAKLLGSTLGSVGGTAFNQSVGLEDPSTANLVISGLGNVAAEGIARGIRTFAKGTSAARMIRSQEAQKILQDSSVRTVQSQVERALGQRLTQLTQKGLDNVVENAYTAVRANPGTLDIKPFSDAIQQQVNPAGQRRLVAQLDRVDKSLGDRMRIMLGQTDDPRMLQHPGRYSVSTDELLNMRQSLQDLKDEMFGVTGTGKAANKVHGKQLEAAMDVLDDTISVNAVSGNTAAEELLVANRLGRLRFARKEIDKTFRRLQNPIEISGVQGSELNLQRLAQEVRIAQEAVEDGETHALSTFAKLLNEEGRGSYKEFFNDIQRLSKLSKNNNIQLFGSSFGILTRGAALASEASGINAVSELLMTGLGRKMMIDVFEVTGGKLTPPLLATMVSATRAGLSGHASALDQEVISLTRQLGQLMQQTGARLAQPGEQPTPVEVSGQGGPPVPVTGQEVRPLGSAARRQGRAQQSDVVRRRIPIAGSVR